ncbi:glycosyltransferase [Novosphingobium sp. AP12]|uniref:glycosyltransferase n=1 Tax=Novosphingobium sp. AP12 TaxID=1144305 RepID=UPI00027214B1|nr:glycosyltransferase [Novosphingobium sp. AP12]EJL32326.1 hypothetical protein PMI02_01511 [Novosphingobium sp. AP12]
MRIAYVVSDLTFPPQEGLHEQTLLTAQLIGGTDRTVDIYGFVRRPEMLDLSAMEKATGLRFAAPPIPSRLPNLLLGLQNSLQPSRNASALLDKLKHYDVIHLENLAACGLVRAHSAARTVAGVIDPGSLRWQRMKASATTLRGRASATAQQALHTRLENRIAQPGVTIHVVSEPDALYLTSRVRRTDVVAIPVALALESGAPLSSVPSKCEVIVFIDLRREHLRQSFLWAAKTVLPALVQKGGGDISIKVLGRIAADPELFAATAALPLSFVPYVDDLAGALQRAALVLVPDRTGTGLKNRVIQAMALGCPVAGTSVAFEGIPATDGAEAIIEEDGARLATRSAALLRDERARLAVGRAGAEFAVARYGRQANAQRWHQVYDRIAGRTLAPSTGGPE